MIKPIFNPNMKENLTDIMPILLAAKHSALYVVDGRPHRVSEVVNCAEKAIPVNYPRNADAINGTIILPNGSRLTVCTMLEAHTYFRGYRHSCVHIEARQFNSPGIEHDDFVRVATEHLGKSREDLQARLAETGALGLNGIIPWYLTRQAR